MLDKIRELARDRGVSIPEVEKACGLSNGTIGKWAVANPKVNNLKAVSDYFGVSIEYFLEDT